MAKPTLLAIAPVTSISGYGKHSVDLVRSIIKMDKFDVKILPIRWGNTQLNGLKPGKDDDIISRLLNRPMLDKQPEVTFQVSVSNEFQPMGLYNIGVTAGVETTIVPADMIEGINRMHLGIVPSNFTKDVFNTTSFIKTDKNTNKPVAKLQVTTPIEVLFEGCDTTIYKRVSYNKEMYVDLNAEMDKITDEFCFLVVGHWLQGNLGCDRKDIGMTVKVFLETFKGFAKKPALILKTSNATFSNMDRTAIIDKIKQIKATVKLESGEELPNIHLLHGELTDEEMNYLYNHDKVKSMVSFTKGEGFGRPMLEFIMSGKPIIASGWSGHVDFLDGAFTPLLPGKLTDVDQSAANNFILKESKWFTVDYQIAAAVMKECYNNYNKFIINSKKLMYECNNKFSLNRMQIEMQRIFERYVPEFPEEVSLNIPVSLLPSKKKIQLPKIKRASTLETNNNIITEQNNGI